MIKSKTTALVLFSFSQFAVANPHIEHDLSSASGFDQLYNLTNGTALSPSSQNTEASEDFGIQILREWKDEARSIPGLKINLSSGHTIQLDQDGAFQSEAFCQGSVEAKVQFDSSHFSVGQQNWGSSQIYTLNFDLPCKGFTEIWADRGSPLAQVLAIWTIGFIGQEKLRASTGLDFWRKKIPFNFPGQGAYYSMGVVHIPNGEEWDVVGHELGHAIFDQGRIGRMAGGEHYIDRCYNQTLALSEGWASYFSAFINLGLNDPDAKFEFMVPRRAPIRFEHVPADVCAGFNNEWRVNAFLWDLIDTNRDNEAIEAQFAAVWNLTSGKMSSGLGQIRDLLIQGGFLQSEIDSVWNQNSGIAPGYIDDWQKPQEFGFQFFDDFLGFR